MQLRLPPHFFRSITPKSHPLIVAIVCTLLFSIGLPGCSNSEPNQTVEPSKTPDPKAEFEWVVKRLEHALETFSPSGSMGLRAKRELSYELFPPSDSHSEYKARVIITSKTFYKPEYKSLQESKPKEEPKAVDPDVYDALLGQDPLYDPLDNPEEFRTELGVKEPLVPRTPVPAPRIDDQQVFELVHNDGKWRLTEQPESKSAQNWFNYALQYLAVPKEMARPYSTEN